MAILTPVRGSTIPPEERILKEKLLQKFLDQNPDFDNPGAIAKAINTKYPKLRMSRNFVIGALNRLGGSNLIKSRHAKIFPEVKALDKIIKKNLKLFKDDIAPEARRAKLVELFAKATKKDLGTAESELISRMRKLGSLYAGNEGRFEAKLYSKIKPPKNYLNSNIQKNFIEATTRAGQVSNATMAKLLGLPQKQINLIANTAHMANAFDFKVAGDHTDIKAMMRDFPNYKKNFLAIEYIKDDLNQIKRPYDIKINNLRKDAERITDPAMRQGILKRAKDLEQEFVNKTGYRIGNFDIKNNKVVINPKTKRLSELKNPFNETLQTAFKNFETTGPSKETFKGVDKKLMTADVDERVKIFEDIKGTPAAKKSKYLQALQKVPKIGKIATAIIGGTAGAGAISTLAQADESKEPETPIKYSDEAGAFIDPKTEEPVSNKTMLEWAADNPMPTAAIASAPLLSKTVRQGTGKILKGLLSTLASPLAATGFAGATIKENLDEGKNIVDATVDPMVGVELLYPEAAKRIGAKGITGALGKALSLGRVGAMLTPAGLGITALGLGKMGYNALQAEKEKLAGMSDEEREAYLAQAQEQMDLSA